MRVITGSARGRKLLALEGLDTRPTSDMVKEALFSIVQFEVEGAVFLDLFAGTGQIGIEALSRGAHSACFVDSSREAQRVILKNIEENGEELYASVDDDDELERVYEYYMEKLEEAEAAQEE